MHHLVAMVNIYLSVLTITSQEFCSVQVHCNTCLYMLDQAFWDARSSYLWYLTSWVMDLMVMAVTMMVTKLVLTSKNVQSCCLGWTHANGKL